MAEARGDSTARFLGRVTLDPRKHVDPIGTVVLPLLAMVTALPFLFGWAKPVPYNPLNLKNRRWDPVWIALAGPGSNLVIVIICTIALRLFTIMGDGGALDPAIFEAIFRVLLSLAIINFVLILFNMIPVPPLDGHYVLKAFLPPSAEAAFERIGPFGIIIAILIGGQWLQFAMPYCLSLMLFLATGGLDLGN